jgi:FKBP-type peptidyl-prolyl cis-trans isomerase
VRRILAVSVVACLLLAGCGGSDSGGQALDDVKVSGGDNPKLTVAKNFSADKTGTKVVKKGDGEETKSGDVLKVNYVAVNGRTGKQFDNSFTSKSPLTVALTEGSVLPGFIKGLEGQNVGSRVLVAIPPKDGFGQEQQTLGIKADDTLVFLFDIVSKVPQEAAGTAKKLPKDVPSIVTKDGHPSGFKATKDTPEKVTKASAHVVVQGTGKVIGKDQSLTAHYVGQVYPDGDVFDESWSKGAPATFQLSQLVKCWQDLIPGLKLGSRVVLVCPSDTAYGDSPPQGGKIKAGDTLLFVIDLLDAS